VLAFFAIIAYQTCHMRPPMGCPFPARELLAKGSPQGSLWFFRVLQLPVPQTADFFEERRARGDVDAALEIMRRKRGEAPREGDGV
jgi:hypothetical protein